MEGEHFILMIVISFSMFVSFFLFIYFYVSLFPSIFPRIATFASLRQSQAESDEEEGQAFYAGGSERRLNILLL